MDKFLEIFDKKTEIEIDNIRKCNEKISKYGLHLTEVDINNIIRSRNEALDSTHRLELGSGIVDKMIMEFCDSQYIDETDFADVISELIEIFYFYKNETKDMVTDDELIYFMRQSFENECGGSIEFLKGTSLAKFTAEVLRGNVDE